MPIWLPLRMRRTKRCERCGLRYPIEAVRCTYCSDLPDSEIEALKQRVGEAHVGNARLGRWLLIAATLLALLLLLISQGFALAPQTAA
jgi:hypothetical protein